MIKQLGRNKVILAIGTLLLNITVYADATLNKDPATIALVSTAQAAMMTDQTSFIPKSLSNAQIPIKPLSSSGMALIAPTEMPAQISEGPSIFDVTSADALGRKAINHTFAGRARDKLLKQHANVISALAVNQDPTFRPLGGGVKNVNWRKITVKGNTAIMQGSAVFWSQVAQFDEESTQWLVARPENKCLIKLALVKTPSGRWQVSEYDWDFAPGSEP